MGVINYTFAAIGPLLFLVPLALIIYIVLVLYAFSRGGKKKCLPMNHVGYVYKFQRVTIKVQK